MQGYPIFRQLQMLSSHAPGGSCDRSHLRLPSASSYLIEPVRGHARTDIIVKYFLTTVSAPRSRGSMAHGTWVDPMCSSNKGNIHWKLLVSSLGVFGRTVFLRSKGAKPWKQEEDVLMRA